jgi:hypothetical protein
MTGTVDHEGARRRAGESVSSRFTRVMNATTSPLGVLTDPSIVGLATALLAIALLAAFRLEAAPALITVLSAIAVVPLAVGVAVALSLAGARAKVVAWLAGLPFPVENLNAVLNGLGESLEVTFRDSAPDVKELNAALDRVSPECFVGQGAGQGAEQRDDGERPPVVELHIGVVDEKRNPSGSNHRRFLRVRALVEEVLLPLVERHPIVEARIK